MQWGFDNENTNTGAHAGVCEILKRDLDLPNLIMIRCLCHNLQLAVSHTTKSLPKDVAYIVSETYNWFAKSSKRHTSYKELYKILN